MNKKYLIKKLTSRKFWLSVAGFVTGVALIFTAGITEETLTGAVMALGSVVAYIVGEGIADGGRGGDKSGY